MTRAVGFAAVAILALAAMAVRAQMRAPEPEAIRTAVARQPATAAERGRIVYEQYGCAMCHGREGKGGFANQNAETDSKVPGVTFVAEGYTAAELARLIRMGTARIGRANPSGPVPPYRMPGWGDRMSDQEVADLATYLIGLYPASAGEKWR